MSRLAGKVAVITGGSSGIGRATARRFVAEGAHVFIVGRRQAELNATKAEIGHGVSSIQADVSDFADLDRLFAYIKAEKGALDIIVSGAGLVESQRLSAATPDHFDKIFSTNARGTYFLVAKALPILNHGGAVVLVASGEHIKGFEGHGAYSASKAAVRSFARTWANELKDRKIRVNTLSPGAIETPMFQGNFATPEEAQVARRMFSGLTPLGRLGTPEEMASAALFLASDDSSFITGFDLIADGGFTQL